ncbi:T9SS type B sorting domain-containing protein [Cellulophaga sp. HaHaR_3_176]|uniref:T9SS type B sorting domain-containing protein n=1 Tax=Cellulophaga sp. HaHaR_3_176 TaxID=1942464 RepID=UPI001C1FC720|nr:T9SS type B sorting domain-containing protein [Cellulophaga sp. HaHaR_3_176]QWX84828.1 T9SS type B sorting domain-containing protein [Cellulophaga sp. HaHaR_3_176]
MLAQVTPAEKAALQAFYTATGGDNWTSQTDANISNDWDFSGPVTNAWKGLSIAGGSVRGIDMNTSNLFGGGNNLTGIIPDELANLQNLVSLDISGANLIGSLPISLTTIPTLTSLNLWGNNLTGDIPLEVTTMTQLTYLNLYYNTFTGFIRPEYGNLTNLTYLNLSENELTGTVPVSLGNILSLRYLILGGQSLTGTLPTSLSNLANLIELSIASTYISGEIPTEYGQLINLEKIDLSSYSNILDGGLTGSIPDSFGNLTKLKKIDLWGNALSGSIPESLANLVDLQEFKISHNDISGTLSPTFSSWVNINEFSVLNNKIEGTIPDSYSVFSNIEVFAVNDNLLSGTLPPNFSLWQDLEIFYINNNQFTGTIPDVYTQWNNIKNFSIQNNNFEGTLPNFTGNTSLNTFIIRDNNFQFGDFENQFNLYKINLTSFIDTPQAKVNDIENITGEIGNTVTLSTTVSGAQNHYKWFKDGIEITTAPDSPNLVLSNLQTTDAGTYHAEISSDIVTDLILERNEINLNVTISCEVSNRAALVALYNATDGPNWVNNTNWNTTAPLSTWYGVTINSNGCVVGIDLNDTNISTGSNNLSGTLPIEMADLTELTYLDLYDGNLNGSFPDFLLTLDKLVYLNLSNHNFTGPLPLNIGDLTELQSLLLFGNDFTGDIPFSVTTLNNLVYIDLSNNELTGDVPFEITQMLSLELLNLESNNFTGFIYPEYSDLSNLKILRLRNNLLSGTIPNTLGNLSNLEYLSLGFQNITGTIPNELGNLSNLYFLSIRRALIDGQIPASVASLPDLRFLFLEENQLSGQIPQELANSSILEVLTLDNNLLNNTIPDFTSNTNFSQFKFNNNAFEFGDFENEFDTYISNISIFTDNPQAKVNTIEDLSSCVGSSITLSTVVSGSANVYQWFKDGTAITGSNNADLVLYPVAVSDAGVYTCLITSTIVTDLTLERNPITLTVSASGPTANTVNDILACDLDADGFTTFSLNLADIESQAFGSQAGLTISYFDTSGNPLTLTNSYTNTTANSQEITARVSDMGGCYNESVFSLITILPETADIITDIVACDSYKLTALSPGNNYYTATNAGGTQLQVGDLITTTQTIYIYAGTGSCADETSFIVTIDPPVIVDQLGDATECESFTLATLTNGTYFTESNGQGTMLNDGDIITETQTIYIYNQSGSCSDESSFTVSISTTIIADTVANVIACDSYTLTALSPGNNYYTATNAGGTQLQVGDLITTTQTIYIYAGTGSCADETSFTVTIDQPAIVDQLGDVTECESFTLATLTNGTYFTESNGQGSMLNDGDIITETQTIYIYNQSGSCSDESSFTVFIDLLACNDSEDATKAKFPKFFTPNNDGINDLWKVDQELFTIEGTISIYDRYGKLLAQFNAENGSWDGSYNGIMVPATDYWFRFKTPDGAITSSGHFSLKR